MNAQAVTILSGIALLVVFFLVGWNLRRRETPGDGDGHRRERKS